MVEVSGEVWESAARRLGLTGLAGMLWRLREPKPLSKAFSTRKHQVHQLVIGEAPRGWLRQGGVVGNMMSST